MTYKIFKIEPKVNCPEEDIFIGYTKETYLSNCMANYRSQYKKWLKDKSIAKGTYCSIFDKYGVDNCQIILLEKLDNCDSIEEIKKIHAHYIKKNKCVNVLVFYKTDEEKQIKKEKETAYKNEKIICPLCNHEYSRSNKGKHFKSGLHTDNLIK